MAGKDTHQSAQFGVLDRLVESMGKDCMLCHQGPTLGKAIPMLWVMGMPLVGLCVQVESLDWFHDWVGLVAMVCS